VEVRQTLLESKSQDGLAQIWHKAEENRCTWLEISTPETQETLDLPMVCEGGEGWKKMERAKGFEPSTLTLAT
jgi:hypothetical protein